MGSRIENHVERDNYGDVYQAARDINYEAYYENKIEQQDPWDELFSGHGFGRALMAIGLIVALAGFGAWAYMIFSTGSSHDPNATPFDKHVLGLPLAVIGFAAFAAGGILAGIGSGMSRAARRRAEALTPPHRGRRY
jgi:hypothetical protein